MTREREVVLGLGANLGSRIATLRAAVDLVTTDGAVTLVSTSPFYETDPVGPPQPRFVNAAARVRTCLSLEALLSRALSVERALGRRRDETERWGPRLVDIDVLWAFDETIETGSLTVPHPRLTERAFALFPLLDVAPEAGDVLAPFAAAIGDTPPVAVVPQVTVHENGSERRAIAIASDPDDALASALAALAPTTATAGLSVIELPVTGTGPSAFVRALAHAVEDGVRARAISIVVDQPALRVVGVCEGAPGAVQPTEAQLEESNGRFVASLSLRIGNSRDVAK